MDGTLLSFLGREREKMACIGEKTCAMRLLSARETLMLRREIAQLDCADEEERALRANAALLRTCLVHEMLDREEALERMCPVCRRRAEEARCSICGELLTDTAGGDNAGFDMARFIRMKEGQRP